MTRPAPGYTIMNSAYSTAQRAIADLKASIDEVLRLAPADGLSDARIGRGMSIDAGHEDVVATQPR